MKYFYQSAFFIMVSLLVGCAATGPGDSADSPISKGEAQPKIDPKIQAEYEDALSSMRDGKTAQAESALKKLVERYPTFSGPRTNLGILYFRAKKIDQAKVEFNEALKINTDNAVSLNHLGIISREEGNFKEAKAYYEKALQIDSNYAYAHLNYGILLELYMGKLNEALTHYKRYQELNKAAGKNEDIEVKKWIVDLGRRAKK